MRQSHYIFIDDDDETGHMLLQNGPPKCVVQVAGDVRLIFSTVDQLVKLAAKMQEAANAYAEAFPVKAEPSFVREDRAGKLHFDDAADAAYEQHKAGNCSEGCSWCRAIADNAPGKLEAARARAQEPTTGCGQCECGAEISGKGLYCQPCLEKLYKEIPF